MRDEDAPSPGAYREDLASIHNEGFGELAGATVTVLLNALGQRRADRGLVEAYASVVFICYSRTSICRNSRAALTNGRCIERPARR